MEGGREAPHAVREGGMASDARIWDWIMQRKEPRSRSSLPPSIRRGVIGAAAIWAGRKKRDLDITTFKPVPFSGSKTSFGQIFQCALVKLDGSRNEV